jgi:hypothetical protein
LGNIKAENFQDSAWTVRLIPSFGM